MMFLKPKKRFTPGELWVKIFLDSKPQMCAQEVRNACVDQQQHEHQDKQHLAEAANCRVGRATSGAAKITDYASKNLHRLIDHATL